MRYGRILFVLIAACGGAPAPELSEAVSELTVVSPSTTNFGTITVGQTSAPAVIRVNPAAGDNYDLIDAITEACGDFSVNAPGLPAEVYRICDDGQIPQLFAAPCPTLEFQSYEFTATFHPTVAGSQSCVVNISTSSGLKTAMLTGTGAPPPIEIDVVPGSIAFGDVRINTSSAPAPVSVRNLGSSPLTVSAVTVSPGYTLGGPTAFTVPAAGSQALAVTCQPTAVGAVPGTLRITSNDPDEGTVSVPLSCAGVSSNLDISPSPAVLPPTRVGEPTQQTIRLVNSGGASTTITSVELASTGLTMVSVPPPNTALAANGGSADVVVGFAATAKGEVSGTLTVTTSEGTRTAQITATALLATMSLTPDGAVDFGPVCVGQTATQPFTVLGTGDGGFVVQAISDPAAPFAIAKPGLPATVLPAGGNEVTFEATAAPAAPGIATSTLTLTTDIPGEAPRTLALSVEGLAAGVSATPAEVDFGSTALGETTIGQPVQLTNCTAEPIELANPRLEGPDAADFAIVLQPPGTTIAPTSSAEWLVVLSPGAAGLKTATFAVDYPGGTATVALLGEGLSPSITDPDGETPSYYSCSAGHAASAWPLLLALALLGGGRTGRRRRSRA